MDGEKDRWGDKLREAERAREDKFFAERDRELLAKLREESTVAAALACPTCGAPLAAVDDPPLRAASCPAGHGIWIAGDDLHGLAGKDARLALDRLAASRSEGR